MPILNINMFSCLYNVEIVFPCVLKCLHMQEKFLVKVELERVQKEQMTVKIKAQWATEEKLRDTFKLSEHLVSKHFALLLTLKRYWNFVFETCMHAFHFLYFFLPHILFFYSSRQKLSDAFHFLYLFFCLTSFFFLLKPSKTLRARIKAVKEYCEKRATDHTKQLS